MLYFAYGSNLCKEQMRRRCEPFGDVVCVKPAVLADYKLCFAGRSKSWDYAGVATIVEAEGSVVHGAIYDLNEKQVEALDGHEGHPGYYKRADVTIDGEQLLTYIKVKYDEYPPSKRYLDTIRQGYLDWKLPVELLDAIKTID